MTLSEHTSSEQEGSWLPVIPLKEMVVFPGMAVPFFLGKAAGGSLVHSLEKDSNVALCTQRYPRAEPKNEDFFEVASTARVAQSVTLPDGSTRLFVEAKERVFVTEIRRKGRELSASVEPLGERSLEESEETRALVESIRGSFRKMASGAGSKIGTEAYKAIEAASDTPSLINLVAGYSPLPIEKKIELLRTEDQRERLEELAVALDSELGTLDIKRRIQGRVRKRLDESRREAFLNEQKKEIERELGHEDDDPSGAAELENRVGAKSLPTEVRERCDKELQRLKRLQPVSPEAGIIRTWLDWIADLPWNEYSHDRYDLADAQEILDSDHYDMDTPKERILDYLAVHQLKPDQKGPILCFVGPPGTGKTSLGASLARSLRREFLRISLGGVRDEAEIRGHRKTYVGALPGKIVQSLRKVRSANPVFLLDEVDKMAGDFRGDPASALLEVLDPEQNATFVDHYLEVPFDLSRTIFLTTANSLHYIPYALRDRMEIIEIPGYTEQEKTRIARGFLIPKQLEANGLQEANITFRRQALSEIIQRYTAESGVRELERQIGTVARKLARRAVSEGVRTPDEGVRTPDESVRTPDEGVRTPDESVRTPDESVRTPDEGVRTPDESVRTPAEGVTAQDKVSTRESEPDGSQHPGPLSQSSFSAVVTTKTVRTSLGKPRPSRDLSYPEPRSGLARGLAWTETGGVLLPVEATDFSGTGGLILTGSLGDVMKESGRIAMSFIRNHSQRFGLDEQRIDSRDIHLHVPQGAIPKDGPSAGIALTVAIVSALTGIAAHPEIAMTGEITLTGRVLPVGGVKEKLLAALRNNVSEVLLPEGNRVDRADLPAEVERGLELRFTDSLMDALTTVFPSSLFEIRSR